MSLILRSKPRGSTSCFLWAPETETPPTDLSCPYCRLRGSTTGPSLVFPKFQSSVRAVGVRRHRAEKVLTGVTRSSRHGGPDEKLQSGRSLGTMGWKGYSRVIKKEDEFMWFRVKSSTVDTSGTVRQ